MKTSKGKVMIGMSGGVDSSVAAYLLMEQGYEVVGATFRLWSPDLCSGLAESSCCSVDDVNDAKFVCDTLGIPHYVLNYKDLFQEKVVDYFAQEYQNGRTPNPCIACNRHIKFSDFLLKAKAMGFDYIATGHYATVLHDPHLGRYRLRRGRYAQKDQSYVLYTMTQEQLASTLIPLGDLSKEETRRIAAEQKLVVSNKPDSQDICFVPDGDYASFLEKYTGKTCPPGDFLDKNGKVLGQHQGIWRYTIGQRKGLGMSFGKPMFVCAIDATANTVTLADEAEVFCSALIAEDINLIEYDSLESTVTVTARIRYSHKECAATLSPLPDGRVRVTFEQPQRAATPGQAVVFYNGDYVAGGGVIAEVCR